jgi:hypothetical protein
MRYLANIHVVDILDQVHIVAKVRIQEEPKGEWMDMVVRVLDRKGVGETDPLVWLYTALGHLTSR